MSHFSRIRTRLVDEDALVSALKELGFNHVELHEQAQHLYGYLGDVRQQTAEVIIRRAHIGKASNDIGFKRGADGGFDAIISDYDRTKYSQKWIDKLTQIYGYNVTRRNLVKQGFTVVTEEKADDESIHLVLRRMS
jgi:hypothetical protein